MDAITALGAINTAWNVFGNDSQKQQNYSLELMGEQYKYNKQAMLDQEATQMRMFENTGYAARVKQLKEAGLNPALIYGMGAGGGGGVTGNISAPQVSGQSAPNVPANTANKTAALGMALSLEKLQSEIDVNKSIAEANRANVPKSTSEADLANQKAKTEILNRFGISLDNSIKEVNLEVAKGSQQANINNAISAAEKTAEEAKMYKGKAEEALNQGKISTEMYNTTMLQKQADLKNTMAEMLANFSKSKLNQQEADAITTQLTQGWSKLQLENQGQKIEWLTNQLRNIKDLDIAQIDAITKIFSSLLGAGSTITGAGIVKGMIK